MAFRKTSFSVYLPDGTRCRGAYYAGDTNLVGIHVHGFRSSIQHAKAKFFVEHALQRGYSWSNFDLPCHGSSEGKFKEFRISAALAALVEVIRQFRGVPILLVGVSMGAWLSILAARKLANSAHTNLVGAILVAPAFDFLHYYFNHEPPAAMRQWQQHGVRSFTDHYDQQPYELEYAVVEDGLQHSIMEQPTTYDFPIQIFHGDQDEVAPLQLSRQFKENSVNSDITLHVIEGGDHQLDLQLPRFAAEMDRMFAKFRVPEAV